MKRPLSDDDTDLVLPDLDGDDEEHPDPPPGGEAELGLDGLEKGDEKDEEIDLDDSTAQDEVCDVSSLIDDCEGDEGEFSALDSEPEQDTEWLGEEQASEEEEEEEDGWTLENDSPEDEQSCLDELISTPPVDSEEDGGEEGIDEIDIPAGSADQDDDTGLPPLEPLDTGDRPGADELEEEEDEEFGRRLLDEIADEKILDD